MAKSVSKDQNIGIFGGTFDPVHTVHLELAYSALNHANLDRVIFIPAGTPPHKRSNVFAPAEDRYNMLVLATQHEPKFEVSKIEIERNGPSYTVETLRAIKQEHPEWNIYLIIGEDTLIDIPNWYQSNEVISMVDYFLVAKRPHCPAQNIPPLIGKKTIWLPFQPKDVASHEIRQWIRENKQISSYVPPKVEQYIYEKQLYRN